MTRNWLLTSKTFPSLLCCRRWVGDQRGNCLYAKIGYNWSGTGKKHEKKLPMGPTLFRSGSSSSQQSHSPTIGLSARYGCEYSGFYIYIYTFFVFFSAERLGDIYKVQTVSCGGARFPSLFADGGSKAGPPDYKLVKYLWTNKTNRFPYCTILVYSTKTKYKFPKCRQCRGTLFAPHAAICMII